MTGRCAQWIAIGLAAGCHPPGPAAPPPATAAVTVGAPVDACRDATLEDQLVELRRFTGDADLAHHGVYAPEGEATPAPVLPSTYDPELRAAWTALVDVADRWGSALIDPPTPGDLIARGVDLDRALAHAGLRYRVRVLTESFTTDRTLDVDYGVDVIGYRIAGETSLTAGGRSVTALDLRTVAPTVPDALGVMDGAPLVLLDAIDDVVDGVMPVLADGEPLALAYDAWSETAPARTLAAAAGAAARGDLRPLVGRDARATRAAIAAAYAEDVRIHESQHAFDAGGAGSLPTPAALRPVLAALHLEDHAAEAANQLSAFMSEIAGDHPLTRLALWHMARFAFSDSPSADSAAAIVVFDQLARALGATVADAPPAIIDGVFDRDRLAVIAHTLAIRLPAELRTAAATSWSTLFGTPYVPIRASPDSIQLVHCP